MASSKKPWILGKSSAPDKRFGREKANNRCSQGRGAPPEKQGGAGGRSHPASRPRIRAKFIVKLLIHRPGGHYVMFGVDAGIIFFLDLFFCEVSKPFPLAQIH